LLADERLGYERRVTPRRSPVTRRLQDQEVVVLIAIQSLTSAPVTRFRVALRVHYPSDVLAGSQVAAALARWIAPTRRASLS
jgi:hypothetical protein